MNVLNTTARGHLAIISTCLIFASNITLTNALIGEWMTPMGYTFTRMLFGTAVFWGISRFLAKETILRRDLLIIGLGGILGFVVSQFAFAMSMRYTTPVNFALIMALVPIAVLVLSASFLRESVTLFKILGILLSIAGAGIIILRGQSSGAGPDNLIGIILAAVSMLSYAIYLIVTKNVSQRYASATIVKWMFLFSAIVLLPFGAPELGSQKIFSPETSMTPILQLLFVLLFDGTLSFFLLLFGLNKLRATTVGTYMNLLPVMSSVIAILSRQDVFSWAQIPATALVVGGVCLVTRSGPDESPAS